MNISRLNPWTRLGLVATLIFSIGFVFPAASASSTNPLCLLTPTEMEDIHGGAIDWAAVVVVITVVAALCAIAKFGWDVVAATWDDNSDGPCDKCTQPKSNLTIIRQKTHMVNGLCVTLNQFEKVQEHRAVGCPPN